MGYCFMTIEKVKSVSQMVRKYEHNYRTGYVPNADPNRKDRNEELIPALDKNGQKADYATIYKEKLENLPKCRTKLRKDAIRGFEIVLTFSREDLERIDIEKWKEDNVRWLKDTFNKNTDKYGENVISAMYHGDENGNVHIHAFIVPVTADGRLCGSDFVNGRAKMISLQTSYANAMKDHGLKRGLRGSSAKHQDIKKFYTKLNQTMAIPLPQKDEPAMEYHKRIKTLVQEERAAGLRELLEKEAALTRRLDEQRQQNMDAVQNANLAIRSGLEADIKKFSKMKEEVIEEYLEIRAQKEMELSKLDSQIQSTMESRDQISVKAQELVNKLSSIQGLQDDYQKYLHQQEVFQYLQDTVPDLAKSIQDDWSIAEGIYNDRGIESNRN